MPASILDTIKDTLGVSTGDGSFDLDIQMYTNSAFGALYQLNAGPVDGFSITDNTATWTDYTTDADLQGMVQAYLAMAVQLAFDPPATSFAINAIQDQLSALEFQILVRAEELRVPSDPFST